MLKKKYIWIMLENVLNYINLTYATFYTLIVD